LGRNRKRKKKFLEAINDDLNMPQVLAILWDLLKDNSLDAAQKLGLIKDFDRVLGLKLTETTEGSAIPAEIEDLILRRQEARAAKNWAESDRLRNEISNLGYVVEDGPKGQTVRPKKFGE
jgi:cysteinyl-tRNA synthetase